MEKRNHPFFCFPPAPPRVKGPPHTEETCLKEPSLCFPLPTPLGQPVHFQRQNVKVFFLTPSEFCYVYTFILKNVNDSKKADLIFMKITEFHAPGFGLRLCFCLSSNNAILLFSRLTSNISFPAKPSRCPRIFPPF